MEEVVVVRCFPNESRFLTAFPNGDPRTGKGGLGGYNEWSITAPGL